MSARAGVVAAVALAAAACKLDSTVFSGDAVEVYSLPATVVPDSLRREVTFTSAGHTLYGYWMRQPGPAARVTVILSHGKGGHLANRTEWEHAEYLWQSGFDVLTYDYRGFGRSQGSSDDETTLAADANAALAYALSQPGVTLARVVSYGHSLGSAPAIALAAANPGIRTLVVESGFSNGQAMAETANPLGIPVTWLLRQPMENAARIATVTAPVLILHGEADIQIPAWQARELYAAARGTKELRIEPGAGHEDVQKVIGLAAFRAQMRSFTNASVP
jgi:hypothetical protein